MIEKYGEAQVSEIDIYVRKRTKAGDVRTRRARGAPRPRRTGAAF